MDFLSAKKVKAIVIACNTASSQVSESEYGTIPLYNVILPSAQAAVTASASGKIGVLGTRATVESGSYERAIHALNSKALVTSQACPLFVPLAEEGLTEDPMTDLAVSRYLGPLLDNEVDTVILGCTHYPLLRDAIQEFCGNDVKLIESGSSVAHSLTNDMQNALVSRAGETKGSIRVLLTDLSSHTEALIRRILGPIEISSIEKVDLNKQS